LSKCYGHNNNNNNNNKALLLVETAVSYWESNNLTFIEAEFQECKLRKRIGMCTALNCFDERNVF